MDVGTWILEKTQNERFPYRLQIIRGGRAWLALRTQDRWPAAGKNIFCLREDKPPGAGETLVEIERVRVTAFSERGRRVSVVLDRKRFKRCDFLFLQKAYKRRQGESYEQVFWLTQRAIQQHRPGFRLAPRRENAEIVVRIDGNERYPWRFPGAVTERGPIPCGDYALMDGTGFLAIIERKTMDNMLADFGVMPVLHQRLAELSAHKHHALVIEASYADFLNPKKLHYYTPAYCAKAIAELHALHPGLNVLYCESRKAANEWTRQFFTALWQTRQAVD